MQVGGLKEVSILRDAVSGKSRGCAFAVFQDKESADRAIAQLDKQYTLPGGNQPIEVSPYYVVACITRYWRCPLWASYRPNYNRPRKLLLTKQYITFLQEILYDGIGARRGVAV